MIFFLQSSHVLHEFFSLFPAGLLIAAATSHYKLSTCEPLEDFFGETATRCPELVIGCGNAPLVSGMFLKLSTSRFEHFSAILFNIAKEQWQKKIAT